MRSMTMWPPGRHVGTALAVVCVVMGLVATALISASSGSESSSTVPGPPDGALSAPPVPPSPPPDDPVTLGLDRGAVEAANEDEYAAAISALVFAMDTRTSTPADLRQQLRAEADPELSESGLVDLYATIDTRVPADALWERMRANTQWSQWQPSRTWEPATWAQVVTQGHAEPGWVMRNVTGVQTTNYVEDGQSRSTSREATLTVVMRCPAEGVDLPKCHLVLISTQPVF